MSSLYDAVGTKLDDDKSKTEHVEDWYDGWLKELMWTSDQHKAVPTAVQS